MKIYNLVELMKIMNNLIQVIGAEKINGTRMECEKDVNRLWISYVDTHGNKMYVQYTYELDIDEEDGYYKQCRVIRNGEKIEKNSLEELVKLIIKYNK